MTLEEAQAAGFLPFRTVPYQDKADSAAAQRGIDPFFLLAIGDRETMWGTSKDLDMKGPKGTGDFAPRNPAKWKSNMPPDRRGWGRGLMQIDYGGHQDFCLRRLPSGIYAWEDPWENILYGAGILHAELTHFDGAMDAAACAYNAGAGATFNALQKVLNAPQGVDLALWRRQCLDEVTTGKDYVSDTLRRMAAFQGTC